MFISPKNKSFYLKTIVFLLLSNFIGVNPVHAFSVTFDNTGFEGSGTGSFDGWNTTGDASIRSTFQSISPTAGSYQGLITNGCSGSAGGLCTDSGTNGARNDDKFGSAGTFNYSDNNQINGSFSDPANDGTDQEAFKLQEFFGLGDNGLSVARQGGIASGFRTAKEGSGIQQDITIVISEADVANKMNAFTLSFNYAYLTNDGTNALFGDQDFAFLSLYDKAGSPEDIIVLADSDQTLTDPTSNNFVYKDTDFHTANNQFSYTVSGLAAGSYTYSLGFGVVDVDNVNRTSGLMLDNLQITQDVPFEFSPGLGLGLMFTLIVADLARRASKADRIRVYRKAKSLKDSNSLPEST